MFKCVSIVGARPQFIKAAPMTQELLKYKNIQEIVVHTGQHFDENMSDIFFEELNIPKPHYQLDIHGGSHAQMTATMLAAIEKILEDESADAVLVYGDTNSTLAGALAASKIDVPVIHVEAGLRSFNRTMPEEINRVLTDHVSDLLFCPTNLSVENLNNEGITKNIHIVGDLMYDTNRMVQKFLDASNSCIEKKFGFKEYILLTMHRPANVDDKTKLLELIKYIESFAQKHDLPVIFPVHPRTKNKFDEHDVSIENCMFIEPLGYIGMQNLLKHATFLLTDSGGMQKEAYFNRVPCITLRDETEWLETISAGWNRLWHTQDFVSKQSEIATYGQGQSAYEIAQIICQHFSIAPGIENDVSSMVKANAYTSS
ncbi:MAG: UDP-N-acetylglucosamine 2-epimerase (non-hydrolyzing) [Francisellaceae bacterium]|nr:UDP-N-acetylglucosamine 2-epimerase (non-hydrolyzing) [Francisellaceae bacterium]